MSHAAVMHQAAILQRPDARGSALGWGSSLVVHALALAWLWHAWLQRAADTDTKPVRRLEVRLVPITPDVPRPLPAPVAVERSSVTQPRAATPALTAMPSAIRAVRPAPPAPPGSRGETGRTRYRSSCTGSTAPGTLNRAV